MLSGTDEGAKTKFSASDGIIENFCRAYVDFGSEAVLTARIRDVSFAPESGHEASRSQSLLSAKKRHLMPVLLLMRERHLRRREFSRV